MKSSNGVRFTVALIVGFVTIFGVLSIFSLVLCSGLYNESQKAFDELRKSTNAVNEEIISQRYNPATEAREKELDAVWKAKRQTYWSYCPTVFTVAYEQEGFGKGALTYFLLVVIIDGIVLGAYQFFGKSKEHKTEN